MTGRRANYKKLKKALAQTPGAEKLYTDWQDRAANSLWDLINTNENFRADVKEQRANKDLHPNDKAVILIKKYAEHGLRFSAIELLADHIENNRVNPHTMKPPVIAVSTKENIAGPAIAHNNFKSLKNMLDTAMREHPDVWVYLVLDPDCTKEDMLEWVNNTWDFVQARLNAIKPYGFKRVKGSKYSARDQAIYQHIKIQREPAKAMAELYDITPEYARKIASRIEAKLTKRDI